MECLLENVRHGNTIFSIIEAESLGGLKDTFFVTVHSGCRHRTLHA